MKKSWTSSFWSLVIQDGLFLCIVSLAITEHFCPCTCAVYGAQCRKILWSDLPWRVWEVVTAWFEVAWAWALQLACTCIVWYLKNSSRLIAALVLRAMLDEIKNQYIMHELLSLDLCLLVFINNSVSSLAHTLALNQTLLHLSFISLSHTLTHSMLHLSFISLSHTHSTKCYYTCHSIILCYFYYHTSLSCTHKIAK